MKTYISGITSILVAIFFTGFLSVERSSLRCTWFIYDDPSIIGTDYPVTLAQAKNQLYYRTLYPGESIFTLCSGTEKLCAICVEVTTVINGVMRPVINGELIDSALSSYFSSGGNSPGIIDFPGLIAEQDLF